MVFYLSSNVINPYLYYANLRHNIQKTYVPAYFRQL